MKFPKCQHENPESAKFCVECGEKLEKNTKNVVLATHGVLNSVPNAAMPY